MENNDIRKFNPSDLASILHSTGGVDFSKTFAPKEIDLGVIRVYGTTDTEFFVRTLENMEVGEEVFLRQDGVPYKVDMQGRSILVTKKTGGCLGGLDICTDNLFYAFLNNGFKLEAKVNMINLDIPMREYRSWKPFNITVKLIDARTPIASKESKGSVPALNSSRPGQVFLKKDRIDVYWVNEEKKQSLSELTIGEEVRFVHKPDEHRKEANDIQILSAKKKVLGYVDRNISQIIARLLDAGIRVYGIVRENVKYGESNKGTSYISELPVIDIYMDYYSYVSMSTNYGLDEEAAAEKAFREWINEEEGKPSRMAEELHLGEARIFGLRDVRKFKYLVSSLLPGDTINLVYKNEKIDAIDDQTGEHRLVDNDSLRVDTEAGDCLGFMQPRESTVAIELLKQGYKLRACVKNVKIDDPIDRKNAVVLDLFMVGQTEQALISSKDAETIDNKSVGKRLDLGFADGIKKMEDISERLSKIKPGDKLKFVREPEKENDKYAVQLWTMDGVSLGYLFHHNCEFVPNLMDQGKLAYGVVRSIHDEGKPAFASLDFWIYVIL